MAISRVSAWLIFSIVVLGSCLVEIRADEESTKEFVLTLDHSNLTDVVSKHDFIVVEFYAPWCGHCKSLAPEYEKAASMLSSNGIPIVLAKVNVDEEANKPLATEYEVQGFPTLKILRNGGKIVQEYKGPRDAEGIFAYLKRQNGPASAEIKSAEEATNFIGEQKIVIVGVFPKFSGEEFETFMSLAEKLRSDYDLGHTLDAKFLPRGESSVSGPFVRLFKPFDELSVDTKVFNVDALEKFVEESSVPILTVFDDDQANHPYLNKFFNSDSDKAMLFLNFSSDMHDSFKVKYHEVAVQTKGNGIIFLIGDVDAGKNAFDYFGLNVEQAPLIIIQKKDGKKYLKPNVEPSQIEAWVKEYKNGNVLPFTKSEPIPETNIEPVKVVVADSLQDVVFNSGKNVLLEFYAPWCGHCKTLAPILEEVAVSYESDSDVMIAKLDATANDVPSEAFEVKGFPTMYFKTASGKVLEYEGDRTKEGIIDFIQKNRDTTATQQEPVKEEEKDEL